MGVFQTGAKIIVGIDILFLLLLGFSFLYIEPGSRSYVVGQITLVPIVLTLGAGLAVLYFDWDPF